MSIPLTFKPLSKTVRIMRMDSQVGMIKYSVDKGGWIAYMDNGLKSQSYSTWPEAAEEIKDKIC